MPVVTEPLYPRPTIGRIVIYRVLNGLSFPAIITMTTETRPNGDAFEQLATDRHVHLTVLALQDQAGRSATYPVTNVPFDAGPSTGAEQIFGSWAWPQRS